ncbi:MAG: DUF1622 domain-containing protein [Geodermatophilaceae bacterium]|nr:DUF1622 domain-containing protein [Geodermatophilaceae bacterium]
MLARMGPLPENALEDAVALLVQLVEIAGAGIIFLGAAVAFVRFLYRGVTRPREAEMFVPVRLSLGRFLTLGLEFQLASDILRTAIAPSFEELGQLAAIATIRTVLNYFLSREIAEWERVQDVRPHDR